MLNIDFIRLVFSCLTSPQCQCLVKPFVVRRRVRRLTSHYPLDNVTGPLSDSTAAVERPTSTDLHAIDTLIQSFSPKFQLSKVPKGISTNLTQTRDTRFSTLSIN